MKEKTNLPFIPSWLNMAGLSQAEFRAYCYLASRADNATGVAWPQAGTIASDCVMAKNTVWKSIGALEGRGLIIRVGKPFQGSNRYKILSPPIGANGIPIEGTTSANEIPIEQPPIGANEILQSAQMATHQSAQMDSREGTPKKVLHRRKNNLSLESLEYASWFKSTLPETTNLKANWQESFANTYDDLIRLDSRTPSQIQAVSQWARNDGFWSTNFMSPVKLRKRNGDGIQYFDVFAEKMKTGGNGNGSAPTSKPPVNIGRRQGEFENC